MQWQKGRRIFDLTQKLGMSAELENAFILLP